MRFEGWELRMFDCEPWGNPPAGRWLNRHLYQHYTLCLHSLFVSLFLTRHWSLCLLDLQVLKDFLSNSKSFLILNNFEDSFIDGNIQHPSVINIVLLVDKLTFKTLVMSKYQVIVIKCWWCNVKSRDRSNDRVLHNYSIGLDERWFWQKLIAKFLSGFWIL